MTQVERDGITFDVRSMTLGRCLAFVLMRARGAGVRRKARTLGPDVELTRHTVTVAWGGYIVVAGWAL